MDNVQNPNNSVCLVLHMVSAGVLFFIYKSVNAVDDISRFVFTHKVGAWPSIVTHIKHIRL